MVTEGQLRGTWYSEDVEARQLELMIYLRLRLDGPQVNISESPGLHVVNKRSYKAHLTYVDTDIIALKWAMWQSLNTRATICAEL